MSLPVAVLAEKAVWLNQLLPSADVSTVTVNDGVVPETAVMSSRTLASRNSAAAELPSLAPLVVRAADGSSAMARAAMVSSYVFARSKRDACDASYRVPGAVRR